MRNREGKEILSCVMTDDTREHGNCGTCRYCRNWQNTRSIKEGEPGYCDHGEKWGEA